MEKIDFAILDWIQEHLRCGFLDDFMPKFTMLGEFGVFFVAVALLLLIFRSRRICGATMLGGMGIGYLISTVAIKNLVARLRPFQVREEIELIAAAPSGFSFPSGHALNSFIAATILMYYDKRLGIPALVIASLLAFSRLYLYVHFPSDVLAGMALGIGFGICAVLVSNKIVRTYEKSKVSQSD